MSNNDNMIKINTDVARTKAQRMKTLAGDLEELLNKTRTLYDKINDNGAGVYYGTEKAKQLGEELDKFASEFHKTYEQIIKYADNIIEIVKVEEQE